MRGFKLPPSSHDHPRPFLIRTFLSLSPLSTLPPFSPAGNDWVAIFEELATSSSFIGFLGDAAGYRVQMCCKSAQALLGIDLVAMRAGAVSATSFLSDIPGVIGLLGARDGAVVTLRNVAASAATTARGAGLGSLLKAPASGEKGFGSTQAVTAKLQTLHIPFVATPLYILRFKRASQADQDTAAAIARIDGEALLDSGEESPRGICTDTDAASDAAEGSAGSDGSGGDSPVERLRGAPAAAPRRTVGQPPSPHANGGGHRVHVRYAQGGAHPHPRSAPHTPPVLTHHSPAHSGGSPMVSRVQSGSGRDVTSFGPQGSVEVGGAAAAPKRVAFMPRAESIRSINNNRPGTSESQGMLGSQGGYVPPFAGLTAFQMTGGAGDPVAAAVESSEHASADQNVASPSGSPSASASPTGAGTPTPQLPQAAVPVEDGALPSPGGAPLQQRGLRQRRAGPAPAATTTTTTTTSYATASGVRGSPPTAVRINMRGAYDDVDPAGRRKKDDGEPQATMAVASGTTKPALRRSSMDNGDAGSAIGGGRAGSVTNGGRAGSVHSRGSGAHSGTSATSFTDVLRRGITSRSTRMEGALASLRRSIIAVFIVIALLNVATLAVSTMLFSQLVGNFELVYTAGQRFLYLQRTYTQFQLQVFAAQGKFAMDNASYADSNRKIDDSLRSIESAHETLYLASTSPAEVRLYTANEVIVQDLVPGTFVDKSTFNATNRAVNLANLVTEFVTRARIMYYLDLADMGDESEPNIWWIRSQSTPTLRQVFNESMMLADGRSSTQSDAIELSNFVVLGVALGMLFLIAATVMVPAVFSVLRAKMSIFDVFIEVRAAFHYSFYRTSTSTVAIVA